MSDYIKREDVMKLFKPEEWGTPDERWRPESEFGLLINTIPSADVVENVRLSPITTVTDNKPTEWVEVVRCRECIHNGSFDTDCPFGWRDERFNLPDDIDFCSYGERKE